MYRAMRLHIPQRDFNDMLKKWVDAQDCGELLHIYVKELSPHSHSLILHVMMKVKDDNS